MLPLINNLVCPWKSQSAQNLFALELITGATEKKIETIFINENQEQELNDAETYSVIFGAPPAVAEQLVYLLTKEVSVPPMAQCHPTLLYHYHDLLGEAHYQLLPNHHLSMWETKV